jgi:O-antigen/teichoic acid export membrane protein
MVPVRDKLLDDAAHAPPRAAGTGLLVTLGTVWLILQTLGTKAVTFSGQLVLAWLLSPADFGQIALAYTVTSFVALLINPGIDVILVMRGQRFHLWSTPAFYFSLTTGLLGSFVILATAPLVARAYGEPQLVGLLTVLAVATPLGSFLLVPTAKLRSEMRFQAIAAINLCQSVLQTLLTVIFAAAGFGVYSFVLPLPVVYIVIAALLWIVARPVVKIRHPLEHWRFLIGDSGYIFGTRVLHTAMTQGDYVILGALYGDAVVGPYFFAYGVAKQAIRLTAGSIQLVLMAGLAQLPAYSAQQTQVALRATRGLTLVGIPLCMLQAAVADPLMRALYGQKWIDAIPLVQLISIGMAFDVISWAAGSLLQSRGQFRFGFYWSTFFAPLFLALVFVGALYGEALGVAIAVCGFFMVCSPLLAIWVFRMSGVSWIEILDMYFRPILVGLFATCAALGGIRLAVILSLPPLLQAGFGITAGMLVIAMVARLIMPSTWHDIMARLTQVRPRRTRLSS